MERRQHRTFVPEAIRNSYSVMVVETSYSSNSHLCKMVGNVFNETKIACERMVRAGPNLEAGKLFQEKGLRWKAVVFKVIQIQL